jgi:hypothetical protein
MRESENIQPSIIANETLYQLSYTPRGEREANTVRQLFTK